MKTTVLERYTKALAAARGEYDHAMTEARRLGAAETEATPRAHEQATSTATRAVDSYIKALREARRSLELALEAAVSAAKIGNEEEDDDEGETL